MMWFLWYWIWNVNHLCTSLIFICTWCMLIYLIVSTFGWYFLPMLALTNCGITPSMTSRIYIFLIYLGWGWGGGYLFPVCCRCPSCLLNIIIYSPSVCSLYMVHILTMYMYCVQYFLSIVFENSGNILHCCTLYTCIFYFLYITMWDFCMQIIFWIMYIPQ